MSKEVLPASNFVSETMPRDLPRHTIRAAFHCLRTQLSAVNFLDDLLSHTAAGHWPAVNGRSCGVSSMVSTVADNATVGATAVSSAVVSSGLHTVGSLCHGATRAVSSVAGSTAPCRPVVLAPAGLAGEGSIVEAVKGGRTSTVDEGRVTDERNVVD